MYNMGLPCPSVNATDRGAGAAFLAIAWRRALPALRPSNLLAIVEVILLLSSVNLPIIQAAGISNALRCDS
jgi:hypothetical protein